MADRAMNETRRWLEAQGFRVEKDALASRDNLADWYAYRKTELPASECETNDGKRMQIVVKPHSLHIPGRITSQSVEIDVTGEAGGVWYKLVAYNLKPDEMIANLPKIEASLIAAWNALHR